MGTRDMGRFAVALALVAVVSFAIVAFLQEVDTVVGKHLSVWERVGILGLALLVLVPLVVYRSRSGRGGFLATLAGTAFWFPWIAAIASSALYLASIDGGAFWRDNALLLGSVIAAAFWLMHALVDLDYATARRQSPGWYGLLMGEVNALRHEVDWGTEPRLGAAGEAVRRRVRGQLDEVEHELRVSGIQWVTRSGFNAAWTHFHRAETTWIEASPTPAVITLAIGDMLRLEGSTIALRPNLQADLWRAATDLDPKLEPYIETLVSADVLRIKTGTISASASATAITAATAKRTAAEPTATPSKSRDLLARLRTMTGSDRAPNVAKPPGTNTSMTTVDEERRSRAVVQSLHAALNDYRGSRWAELARARWQLMLTTTIAGTFSLLVLGLALIQSVPPEHLVAGWAYFLVGAVAGLFVRLRQAGEEEHVADDYGLESARLNQTPLLSGMAAVIGVVLMASLAGSTLGDVLPPPGATQSQAPVASAAVDASGSVASGESAPPSASAAPSPVAADGLAADTPTTATLATAFDLGRYPVGLIIALIFGLTPSLVLQRLGMAATLAKKDLVASRMT